MQKYLFTFSLSIFLFTNISAQQTPEKTDQLLQFLSADLKQADSLFTALSDDFISNENDSVYAKYYFLGGILNYYKEQYILSESYYKKALNTNYSTNNPSFQTRIYNNMGVAFELSQRFDSAYFSYQQSLAIERQLENEYGVYETQLNIGLLNIKMKQFESANELLNEALTYFKSIDDTNKIALCYQNFGVLYEATGSLLQADSAASVAVKNFKLVGNTYGTGETYFNLISYQTLLGNYSAAYTLIDSCKSFIDPNGYVGLIRIPLITAKLESGLGNYDTAIAILTQLSNNFNSDLYVKRLGAEIEMEIFAKMGNAEAHQAALNNYKLFTDSLDRLNNKREIAQLRVIHQTEEVEQELSNQKVLLEQSLREKGLILIFSIISIAALLVILLFKRRLGKLSSYIISNAKYRRIEQLEESDGQNNEKQLYAKAIEHLKSNQLYLQTDLKLEKLAFEIGTNISTLSKCINEVSGNNFSFLVNRLRVRYAEELLLSTDYSVNDIAEHAGFSNRTSFYRSFKLITGLPPKDYKQFTGNK